MIEQPDQEAIDQVLSFICAIADIMCDDKKDPI